MHNARLAKAALAEGCDAEEGGGRLQRRAGAPNQADVPVLLLRGGSLSILVEVLAVEPTFPGPTRKEPFHHAGAPLPVPPAGFSRGLACP